MLSDRKLIIAGNTLHFYHYNYPQKYGQKEDKPKKQARKYQTDSTEEDISNDYRSKKAIKRIVEANAGQYLNKNLTVCKAIFATLTFKENVTELQDANRLFKKFIMRLNYSLTKDSTHSLKYLVVPEFQKKTRDAVHYHVIFFNLPYIEKIYDRFADIWKHGNVNIKTVYNTNHLTNYVVKYVTKQARDERTFNKKKYFTSRDIYRPKEVRVQNLVEVLMKNIDHEPVYGKQFHSGTLITKYQCYTITQEQKSKINSLLELVSCYSLPDISHLLTYKQLELTLNFKSNEIGT